ncbi:uncharacterized protein LOC130644420 isoform X3 [Hydractinia symbiolongicarpus]|uniref:uncharacterized protein LOC130644420 isoform X3 n=1 Tax=Hydractinia symbiolongicarpus TaxID=13093 RepID=UPI00254A30E3|nr:uncharacterized protein LOC130644420 isoform X3 [Hydractinia symbiolongicarpus]
MSDLDSLEPVVDIDAYEFTDTERQLILKVIARDEDIRVQEKSRIEHLKDELRDLRERGVPEDEEEAYGRVCKRCRVPLGIVFGTGAFCPNCDRKVCKTCRVNIEKSEDTHSWLCTVCSKIRDIRAESGAWFYDGGNKGVKKKKVYGSFLIKKMFSKTRKRDTVLFKDPTWEDIIEQDEPLPEEDEKYIMISSGASGEYVTEEVSSTNESDALEVEALENELLNFAEEMPASHIPTIQHCDSDEDIYGKVLKPKLKPKSIIEVEKEDIVSQKFNFTSMQKATEKPKDTHVPHNDLDLREFHKLFVRKSNLKLQKVRTDEHSDDDDLRSYSSSSSSSLLDSESNFVVPQAAALQKNSSDEEFTKLNEELTCNFKKEEIYMDEELMLNKDDYKSKSNSVTKIEEGSSKTLMFSNMSKLDSLSPVVKNDDNYQDNSDDFKLFAESISLPKKKKFQKAKTDEHSDKEESLESSDKEIDAYVPLSDDRVAESDTEENLMKDFSQFVNEIQSPATGIQSVDVNEDVQEKVFRQKEELPKMKKEDTISQKFNFTSMQKRTEKPKEVQVVCNDLDLREFHKLFVRKKNLKLQKVKTDEQSEDEDLHSSSSSLSSSDSESSFVVPQVASQRRNSSDEEFTKLNEELTCNFKKEEIYMDEELVLNKDDYKSKSNSVTKIEEDSSIKLMLSNMSKLDSLSPVVKNDDNYQDNSDDFKLFAESISLPKKKKFQKAKTEEHSDKEESSDGSDNEEIGAHVSLDQLKETRTDHFSREQNDEENMDAIFEEFKQKETEDDVDSIGEISDDDDDDDVIHPFVSVAGEILLGLKYNYHESIFEVQVHKAKDLIAADQRKNTTDPYVKVYLLPDSKRGGKRKTKAKRHSLNPDFDEVLEFKVPFEELVTRTCSISVWHNDSFDKNLHLGEVNLNIQEYINSGFSLEEPSPQWYTLCAKKVNEKEVVFVGHIVMLLNYKAPGSQVASTKKEQKKLPNPTKGSLMVTILDAHNLPSVYGDDGSNPFCKVNLLSDTSKFPKFKTPVVKGTTDPHWDYSFEFPNVSWTELKDCVLQVAIYDYERGSANVLLAGTRIGLGKLKGIQHDSFGEEINVWQSVLDNPNDSTQYTIPLRSTLDSVKAKERYAPAVPVKIITDEQHDDIKKKTMKDNQSFTKRLLAADTMSLASSGSVLSIYSMAGGEHGNIVISGEILFSIKHDVSSGIFSVTIVKAKGLAPVNTKQLTSDPYVKVYMLPDKTKTTKKKTTFRRKTLNPQWNETIKYKFNREELLKKTLQVTAWNHDRFGRNDFLGEVQVNMKHYASKNNLDKEESVWYTLQEAAPVSVGGSYDNKGELVISIKFEHDVLSVQVKEAHGLTTVDPENLPSPFVKCYLLPDKSRKSKRKTTVQKKTIQPVWNEKFDYKNVQVSDLQTRVLEVTVWDYHSSGHQFLGGLRLGLSQGDEYWHDCFNKEVNIWEAMIKHLGIFAEYVIPLRATMTSRKGQEPVDIPMITKTIEEKAEDQDALYSAGVPCMRVALQYVEYSSLTEDELKKKKGSHGELKIHLKEGRHLYLKADGDLPSSFCKMYLQPKKKHSKVKTETYIKSTHPAWDVEKSFEGIALDELRTRVLEIEVRDEINEKKSDLIGLVRLGSGGHLEAWDDSKGEEVELWNSMLNNPNHWQSLMIPIRKVDTPLVKIESIPEKEKKEPVKEEKKKPVEKDAEDSDEETFSNTNENDGSESPRTSALRAMGVHAAGVVDMMQNRDAEQQPEYSPPQESLSPISEENELDSSGSQKMSYEPSVNSMNEQNVPNIMITSSDVKYNDPVLAAENDDEFEDDYPIKKKQPPSISFLKRSTSRESLTSIYSTDSANIYGQVPVRGDVQFGMKYNASHNTFEVHVFQAKDIAAIDTKKQQSDPYCKVYLLPDKTKHGKKKTKTRKKTLNPEWEEILEYKISRRDLRTRTLWLALWHLERFGRNIFLGEVMLNMDSIVDDPAQLESPTPQWYTLCEKGSPPMTELYKGELLISLMFEDPSVYSIKKTAIDHEDSSGKKKKKKKKEKSSSLAKIHLHIKEARDLPSSDKDGLSDPFCKCYLLPLKSNKTKRKSPVIKSTLNPVWDFKTEYETDYEDLADSGIEFTVWDWDRGSSNDFLGCARLSLGLRSGNWDDAEGKEITAWQHLIDNPNKWAEFVIPLRSKSDTRPKKI